MHYYFLLSHRYGKALLGLSREESGVLGDGVPGSGNADEEEEDNEGKCQKLLGSAQFVSTLNLKRNRIDFTNSRFL